MEKSLYKNMVKDIEKVYERVVSKKPRISKILLFIGLWKSKVSLFDKIIFSIPSRYNIKYKREERSELLKTMRHPPSYRKMVIEEVTRLCKKYNLSSPFQDYYSLRITLLVLGEVFVRDEYQAHKLIKKDDIVIDGGANIGAFTLLASNYTNNKIIAFEPARNNYDTLKKNVVSFNLKGVILVNKGLGSEIKNTKLLVHKFKHGSHTVVDSKRKKKFISGYLKEDVQITTLDNFVKENKLKKVDFIKLDIEGYELEALKGAKETIRRFKPKMAICAYHHPLDKKRIPKFIMNIRKDYKFKLLKKLDEILIFW